MTLVGLHSPNAPFTSADFDIVRIMQAQSVKLLSTAGTQHTPDDVARLRALGVGHFTVRLRDSREPDGHIPSYWEYAAHCIIGIQAFYAVGVRNFQVDNEPQYLWAQQDVGPWQYQWFIKRAVPIIRQNVPGDVRLISPPLSFSPALWSHGPQNPTAWLLDDWFAAFAYTDGGQEPSVYSLFDAVGANCYFQSDRQMRDPSFGECWETVHGKSGGKPVVILEWASSANELTDAEGNPRYTPAQVEALRIAQYPEYLARAKDSGVVEASYVYISAGATPDWADFRVTPNLARAMLY